MSSTLTATIEERVGEIAPPARETQINEASEPVSSAPAPKGWFMRYLENGLAKRLGHRQLVKLASERGRVAKAWSELPDRMHLVANQTKLLMELVDDFRAGRYRDIPWRSIVVGVAAILYTASPADLIPDVLVGLGVLDDIAVVALVARVLRSDLQAYCRFKGYRLEDYFPPS